MLPNPTIEEPNLKSEQNPLSIDPSIADLEDFCSSLLDFDSIKDWCSPMDDDVAFSNPNLEKDGTFGQLGELGTLIEGDIGNKGLGDDVAELSPGLGKTESVDLGALIEGNMGRVKLEELDEGLVADVADLNPKLEKADWVELGGDIDGTKIAKVESDSSSSDSESESKSESESSDSSSSSDDDDDEEEEEEEKVKEKVEVEDGEINDSDVEKVVGWSEDEFGDEDGGISKGPIKSRNELKDLPHVPPVEASLQPHHHTVPVGVISSIIDAQVIVEGVEQHNPLNEGTIFWVTESRTALGIVDEIFGPVKSPYYIIRYNSEDEVPEGIKQGTPISFVPEFANHVLKDNLYKKGYDASGENDEEVSDDYEFSDDEQEAEYRKLQKMKKKRGTNEANYTNEFNKKNFKNRGGGSHQNQFSRNNVRPVQNNVISKNSGDSFHNNAPQGGSTQVTTNQNQQNGNDPNPFTVGQNYGNPPSFIPPFQQMVQSPGFILPPNVMWMNGMPGQPGMMNGMPGQPGMMNGMTGQPGMMNGMPGQPGMMNGMTGQPGMMNGMAGQPGMMNGMTGHPGMMNGMTGQPGMMNGIPGQQGMVFPNGMMWPQQNLLPNGVPFPQQFAQNQNFAPNGVLPETQPNFSGAPSFGPRPGSFAQNGPNQQLGLAMPMNMNRQQCPSNPGSMEMPQEFDQGAHRGGGRGPQHRGGGRSRGGRRRHQAK